MYLNNTQYKLKFKGQIKASLNHRYLIFNLMDSELWVSRDYTFNWELKLKFFRNWIWSHKHMWKWVQCSGLKSAQTNLIKSGFKKKHSFSVSHKCIALYILLIQRDYGTVTESTNTDIKSDVCTSEKLQWTLVKMLWFLEWWKWQSLETDHLHILCKFIKIMHMLWKSH